MYKISCTYGIRFDSCLYGSELQNYSFIKKKKVKKPFATEVEGYLFVHVFTTRILYVCVYFFEYMYYNVIIIQTNYIKVQKLKKK